MLHQSEGEIEAIIIAREVPIVLTICLTCSPRPIVYYASQRAQTGAQTQQTPTNNDRFQRKHLMQILRNTISKEFHTQQEFSRLKLSSSPYNRHHIHTPRNQMHTYSEHSIISNLPDAAVHASHKGCHDTFISCQRSMRQIEQPSDSCSDLSALPRYQTLLKLVWLQITDELFTGFR